MVRTRANNAAMRKAVVAKAPRKQLAPSRPVGPTSPGGGGKGKKGVKLVGGNPAKVWPTPTWQKGIQTFLAGGGEEGECSSSSSSANTSLTSEHEAHLAGGKEMDCEGQCSSSSGAVGVALLDDDIAQLNSDDED